MSRVFAGDHINIAQDIQRPERYVLEVADRRRDKVERSVHSNFHINFAR
jgi:hypothetical protein